MKCDTHPKYMGRKKPRIPCQVCSRLWQWARFSDWAIREGFFPEELTSDVFMFLIKGRLAKEKLLSDLERDMYGSAPLDTYEEIISAYEKTLKHLIESQKKKVVL